MYAMDRHGPDYENWDAILSKYEKLNEKKVND